MNAWNIDAPIVTTGKTSKGKTIFFTKFILLVINDGALFTDSENRENIIMPIKRISAKFPAELVYRLFHVALNTVRKTNV